MKDDEVYEIGYTNEFGYLSFNDINFSTIGSASLVASKQNFYSDEKSISINNPPPLPSCPVLFSYDGSTYNMENPLLTACEKSNYINIVTDYYHINNEVKITDGKIKFLIKEMEDEITYLEGLELLVVENSKNDRVGVTKTGKIFSYNDLIQPIYAVDNNGVDRLIEVSESDNTFFESETAGYIVVKFLRNESSENVFRIGSGPKNLCPPIDDPATKITTDLQFWENSLSDVSLEILDESGNWNILSDLPPRINIVSNFVVSEKLIDSKSNIITVRTSWNSSYNTDQICMVNKSNSEPSFKVYEISAVS
ncbi:MAG: hypothetical protein L3J20_12935 [Flavobacteriaceae bacterium]|nr:hypothetical protein [Flavobacteriaceae bacterium]